MERGRRWERGREDGIGEGVEGAKKRKKAQKKFRRDQNPFIPHAPYIYRRLVALAGTRQLHSQGPVPVHAHRTERVTGSKRQE